MKVTQLLMILIIGVCAVSFMVPPADAQTVDRYFCETVNTDWFTGGNWWTNEDCTGSNGVPDGDDYAIIKADLTCNIDDPDTVGAVEVRSGATLNIETGTLAINGDAETISLFNGTLVLEGANSAIHFTDVNQALQGSGKITGQNAAAEILIAGGKTLTSQIIIQGLLTIRPTTDLSDGDFVNQGTVHANVSGPLTVNAQTVDDSSSGLWKVSVAGAVLQFNPRDSTAAAMEGDFTVEAGTLDVEAPGIDTTGTLTFTGGTIDCTGMTTGNTAKFTGS